MKLYLVPAILALFFCSPAQAIVYPFKTHSLELEAKLPTQVKVFCTANTSYNFAVIADREIYLSENVCSALLGGPSPYSFGLAAHVLYHEWWHVAFRETDERLTECGARAILRYVLHTYWGMTAKQAQAVYRGWTDLYAPLPC